MNSDIEFKFMKESSNGLKYSLEDIGKLESGEMKYKIIKKISDNIDHVFYFHSRVSPCVCIFRNTLDNSFENEKLLVLISPIEIKCDDETDFLTNNFVNCECFIAEENYQEILNKNYP